MAQPLHHSLLTPETISPTTLWLIQNRKDQIVNEIAERCTNRGVASGLDKSRIPSYIAECVDRATDALKRGSR